MNLFDDNLKINRLREKKAKKKQQLEDLAVRVNLHMTTVNADEE